MPIYEYICQECKKEFELIRPMSQADQPIPCTDCGGENVKRKLALFYAQSGGSSLAGTSAPTCGSCRGGSCSTCGE